MMSSTQPTDNGPRIQRLLFLLGLLAVGTFWHVFYKEDEQLQDDTFDLLQRNVDEDEEEDFVTSQRSAINTIELPNPANWATPQFDASRPTLILHVGPIRSGVPELAAELSKLKDSLALDKYSLASDAATSALHTNCQRELHLARKKYDTAEQHTKDNISRNTICHSVLENVLERIRDSAKHCNLLDCVG